MAKVGLNKDSQIKDKYLYKTYGITLQDFNSLVKSQSNKCFICGNSSKLAQDHLHAKNYKKMSSEDKKKYNRGALCYRCNKWTIGGIEIHKDARKILININKYFELYPTKGDIK